MRYTITSYNGRAINDTTNYSAFFVAGVPLLPQTDPILIERSENWPVFAGKSLPGHEITLEIRINGAMGAIGARRDELKAWFATDDQALRKLLISDPDNAGKQWYLMATPTDFVVDGRRVILTLSVPDPYWRSETVNSDTWTVTASGQTRNITVGGNANARPTFAITPNNAKAGGFGYKRFVAVRNTISGRKLVDYPVELTGGGWNTAAEVTAGRMQADADDLRVMVDDTEVARLVAAPNAAATKVWSLLTLPEPVTLTLNGGIGSGAISTLNFRKTGANKAGLKRLGAKFILQIENEFLLCSAPNANGYRCAVTSRAAFGSIAAAHADATACYHLPHAVWVYYGNSVASAPDLDTSRLPIFDTANSTNTSWVYADFADADGLRAGSWVGSLLKSDSDVADGTRGRGTSDIYTATQVGEADPASVAGIQIAAYQKGGAWKGETASVEWRWNNPVGATHVASASGSKYRVSTDWPSTAALQKYTGGAWANVTNQAMPASAASWTAWSIGSTALGASCTTLRLHMNGSVKARADNYAALEMNAITLTLDSSRAPSVTFGAQQGNYDLDAVLTNTTTGDSLILRFLMGTGQTLTINCEDKTVIHATSGANARPALDTDTRRLQWMDCPPGVNTFQWTESGVANCTIVTTWRDRNS